jgi:hypothetical protein
MAAGLLELTSEIVKGLGKIRVQFERVDVGQLGLFRTICILYSS